MAYASAPRSSSRKVKPRRDADFVYDTEEVGLIIRKNSRVEFRQTQSFIADSPVLSSGKHYNSLNS